MAQRKTLTEQQIDLLRWIADGCPDGRYDGTHHRISAAALRSRGLVKITGRGDTWTATITRAGTEYLGRTDGPNPPAPRQPNGSVTEQLVGDVIAAGGTLRLPRRRYGWDKGAVDWDRRANLANQHCKAPDGKQLRVTYLSGTELQIDLVDGPAGLPGPPTKVPIPDAVSRYHPVVRAFRDATDCHEVSRAVLPRTLLVLQALVTEAERRGMTVRSTVSGADRRGWSGPKCGHLTLAVGELTVEVRVIEDGLVSRVHWEGQVNSWAYKQEHPGRATRADYEAPGTGKLRLEILTYNRGPSRQAKWTDSRKGTVEDRLGEIVREVELRAVEREERKRLADCEAILARAAWEAAVEQAKVQVVEHQRGEVLDEQVRRWTAAQQIRTYADAITSYYASDDAACAWADWARARADGLDPLQAPPRIPAPPEDIFAEDLRPFMRGHDPYGPPEVRFLG